MVIPVIKHRRIRLRGQHELVNLSDPKTGLEVPRATPLKLRSTKTGKFTIGQMLEAGSTREQEILDYAALTGKMPKVRDLPSVSPDPYVNDRPPEVFPRYVPGSSCPQKGDTHMFFKKGNRDICSKCGSSRATRL